jgi:hypothetical protein
VQSTCPSSQVARKKQRCEEAQKPTLLAGTVAHIDSEEDTVAEEMPAQSAQVPLVRSTAGVGVPQAMEPQQQMT